MFKFFQSRFWSYNKESGSLNSTAESTVRRGKLHLQSALLAFVTLSSCNVGRTSTNEFNSGSEIEFDYFITEINSQTVEDLTLPKGASVSIQSTGGMPADFYSLADKLRNADARMHFTGLCLSACAEILAPLSIKKYSYPDTLIGYHWNAHVNYQSIRRIAKDPCKLKYLDKIQEKEIFLYAQGARHNYFEVSSHLLDLVSVSAVPNKECEFELRYRYQMWFPTSEHLNALMGISFEESICNDSVSCVERVYQKRNGQGVVIGSDKYMARKDALKYIGTYKPYIDEYIEDIKNQKYIPSVRNSETQSSSYCAQDGAVSRSGGIEFCGPFNEEAVLQIKRLFDSATPKFITITSQGGESKAAIAVARLIEKHQVPVIISDRCLSACAHFVLMPAANVTIESNSLIGFHHTATSLQTILDESKLLPATGANIFKDGAEIELDFYNEFELDINWLSEPHLRMSPSCFVKFNRGQDGQIASARIRGPYRFWTPQLEFINSVRNSNVKGWWPDSAKTHDLIVRTKLPYKESERYRFQSDGDFSFSNKGKYFLPDCKARRNDK